MADLAYGMSTPPSSHDEMERGESESQSNDQEEYNRRRVLLQGHLQELQEERALEAKNPPCCWYCVCRRCLCGCFTSVHPFRVRCLDWVSQLLFWYSGAYSPGGTWNRDNWDRVAVQYNSAPAGLDRRHNVDKRDHDLDMPHGVTLPIRVYQGANTNDLHSRPLMLFMHGGGFCIGTRDQKNHDELCTWYAREGFVVVSVTYRMAPEDPFPAGVQDCYELMHWMKDESRSGTVLSSTDRKRFVLAGDSAGGNFAAVLSCLNRDGLDADLKKSTRPPVNIVYQVLFYPALYKVPSKIDKDAKGDQAYFISKPVRTWFSEAYLPTSGITERAMVNRAFDPRLQPYSTPRACNDLAPCTIVSADCDLLCVENVEVAAMLQQANVSCRHHIYKNVPHGFATFDFLPQAKQAFLETMKDMRDAGVFESQSVSATTSEGAQ